MKKQLIMANVVFLVGASLVSTFSFGEGGYFTRETCEQSRGFAKRVFLTKQLGSSFSKYRESEGSPPPGKAGELVGKIEQAVFTNSRITSESLASEYAYSICINWPK